MASSLSLVVGILVTGIGIHAQILPPGYPCEVIGSSQPVNMTNCEKVLNCTAYENARYRTMDGTCNNVNGNPEWGSARVPFVRLARRNPLTTRGYPQTFHLTRSGDRQLPNARAVSNRIHSGTDSHSHNLTTLVMQFGQILDHDLTLTPEMNLCHMQTGHNNDTEGGGECAEMEIDCCSFVGALETPKSCYPIRIPNNDGFYRAIFPKPTCLDFKRSQPFPCNYSIDRPDDREQFNIITAFLDGSQFYGSDEKHAKDLRSGFDGLMKTSGNDLMPLQEGTCPHSQRNFVGGDERVNENPGLQSLHTVWIREHNRLARAFKATEPTLDDEELYQEARRLVIGEWQNIVYSEFLPIILGPKTMRDYELNLPPLEADATTANPTRSMYKSNENPNIINAFATAAFRFGHSLISGPVQLRGDDIKQTPDIANLKDNFFNTGLMHAGKMGDLLRGMCWQDAEVGNNVITDEVRNFLFRPEGSKFGMDLAARNIQRGRDHELASYDSYRLACGLRGLPKNFLHQAPKELPNSVWRQMDDVYSRPGDIELFPGGMSEKPVEGGVVGPTFACIIAEQFRRIKFGDRYFFTHSNSPQSARYCDEEVEVLKKRTMRDVLCDVAVVTGVPANPFRSGSGGRRDAIPCEQRNRLQPKGKCMAKSNEADDFLKDKDVVENEEPVGDVALLMGGFDGYHLLDSVEIFSPNNTCPQRLTPLPNRVFGLVAFYFYGSILACGGRTVQGISTKDCWVYMSNSARGSWSPLSPLNVARHEAAGVAVTDRLFITGGRDSPYTSEVFDPNVGSYWRSGPRLIVPRYRHSMVAYQDAFILVGGRLYGDQVEMHNCTSGSRFLLKPLLQKRTAHSSVLLPGSDNILSLGGFSVLSSVYSITQQQDRYGPRSSLAQRHGQGLELNGKIFFFGGDKFTTLVEEYCEKSRSFKRLMSSRLLSAKSGFGVTKVPAMMFAHLPSGCRP